MTGGEPAAGAPGLAATGTATRDAGFARRIAIFTLVGHALTHLYLTLFPPLLDSMAVDFGLDTAPPPAAVWCRAAFYYTVANVCFGLGAVPAGWLASRRGDKPLLAVFFLGSALGGVMIGSAREPWLLFAGAVCLGLATSIYHPVGVALLSKGARKRGLAMGVNGVAGSLGTAAGPFYAFAVLHQGLSWRWAFLLLALPSCLLGAWLCAARLGPAAAPFPRAPRGGSPEEPAPARPKVAANRIALFSFLLAAMMLGGFTATLAITRLPPLLSRTGFLSGLPQEEGRAILTGLALLLGGVGQLAAGFLADRVDERKLYVVVLGLASPLVFLLGHSTGWPLLGLSALAFILMFAAQPIENSMLARYSPPGWRAVIYGWKFILVFGVGGTGSLAAGLIEENRGLSHIYQVGGGTLALACAFAVLAWLTRVPNRS